MFELLQLASGFGAGGIAIGIGWIMGKKSESRKADPSKDFICPYCDNLVTGFKELDLIHHVTCIGKSEADFAAAEKKAAEKKQDEYHFDSVNEEAYSRPIGDSEGWVSRDYKYKRNKTHVYRNGEFLKTIYASNENVADGLVKAFVNLDMHKRKHGKK